MPGGNGLVCFISWDFFDWFDSACKWLLCDFYVALDVRKVTQHQSRSCLWFGCRSFVKVTMIWRTVANFVWNLFWLALSFRTLSILLITKPFPLTKTTQLRESREIWARCNPLGGARTHWFGSNLHTETRILSSQSVRLSDNLSGHRVY